MAGNTSLLFKNGQWIVKFNVTLANSKHPILAEMLFRSIPLGPALEKGGPHIDLATSHLGNMSDFVEQELRDYLRKWSHADFPVDADTQNFLGTLADSVRVHYHEPGHAPWELETLMLKGEPAHDYLRHLLESERMERAYA